MNQLKSRTVLERHNVRVTGEGVRPIVFVHGLSGYDAALAIRKLEGPAKSQIPILAFSGSTSFDGHEIADGGVFQAVIGKPFKPVELVVQLLPYVRVPSCPN